MNRIAVGLVWAMSLVMAACGGSNEQGRAGQGPVTGDNESEKETPVTFSHVQAVLDEHCVDCHTEFSGEGVRDLLLTRETPCFPDPNAATIVMKKNVVPGDPANSSLWHKIANVDLSCGREMPVGGLGLIKVAPEDFHLIEAWILAGAPE